MEYNTKNVFKQQLVYVARQRILSRKMCARTCSAGYELFHFKLIPDSVASFGSLSKNVEVATKLSVCVLACVCEFCNSSIGFDINKHCLKPNYINNYDYVQKIIHGQLIFIAFYKAI